MSLFRNRSEAGQELARLIKTNSPAPDALILALPRGGVVVAAQVAQILDAELDIALVRKLGVPGREELAFGAIATGNVRILNHEVLQQFGMDRRTVEQITERAK